MSLEQKINYQLNKYPKVKKVVKYVYQHAMYAVSPKVKSEGNITRISPEDDKNTSSVTMISLHGMRQIDMFYA